LGLFKMAFAPVADRYEDIQGAVNALETAIHDNFPEGPQKKSSKKIKRKAKHPIRRLQNQLVYLRACKRKLEHQLAVFQSGKQGGNANNRTTPEFLAKVALSWPTTCARGFSDAWRDLVGVGVSGCSRSTITKIRDSFVEVIQENNIRQVTLAAALSTAAASAPGTAASAPGTAAVAPRATASVSGSAASAPVPGFFCVALLHIHDEASLRLRSSADTDLGAASWSRTNKVH
jgi:hypothetical protein